MADLSNLEPRFGGSVQSFIDDLNKQYANQGLVFQPVSGYRSQKEQKGLYDTYMAGKAQGLPDSALTKAAAPGQSFHNWGGAVDIMPFRNGVQLSNAEAIPILNTVGPTASKYGMTWGGAFDDRDHFQAGPHLQNWLSSSGRSNWKGPDTVSPAAATTTPGAPGRGFNLAPGLEEAIQAAAAKHPGVSADYLRTIAMIESNGGRNLQSQLSSAKGPFQFINSTAAKYGLANPMDFGQSADAAARLAIDNKGALERLLGRPVSDAELYLAHQQGTAGAHALLGNPDRLARDVLGPAAVANNIPKGSGYSADTITAKQLGEIWLGKYANIAGGSGGATPAAGGGGGAATPAASGGTTPAAPPTYPGIVDTPASREAATLGQELAGLANAFSPGGGTSKPPDPPDQPLARMPALDAVNTRSPDARPPTSTGSVPTQLAAMGGITPVGGPLDPAAGPTQGASITQGAPSMTSMLDTVGTPVGGLDPRRFGIATPYTSPLTRFS
jgi:hypothetical protein